MLLFPRWLSSCAWGPDHIPNSDYLYRVLILPGLYFRFHKDATVVSRQENSDLKQLFSASRVSGKGPGTRAALF